MIENQLQRLAGAFGIDLLGFAIMSRKALGTLKQFRFAESVMLMTAEREGAKASQGARNHKIFVVALPENA